LQCRDFARDFLVGKLRTTKIVVGEDFHFGNQRKGTVDFFKKIGAAVETVPLLKLNNIYIKTKLLKQFIASGDLVRLKRFLKRDHGILAKVERGKGVGRRLGYPTANLKRESVIILPPGIYVVRVFVGPRRYRGISYIGTRPTFNKGPRPSVLEVHILDFKMDLYGKTIGVEFLKKLRDDRVFADGDILARAIAYDVKKAREYFVRNPSWALARSSFRK